MQKLILWDIDGTLMTTGGVAAMAMRESLEQIFGTMPPMERVSYAGKTDRQIMIESFPDLPQDAVFNEAERFGKAYLQLLTERRTDLLAKLQLLPGVLDMLQRLHGQAYQGVLTGNLATIADYKLAAAGLLDYLDLEASAFGSDHHHRPSLLPIAVERAAQRYGHSFNPRDIIVIGDTPNDINCGRSGGARTVAVATGSFSVDDLRPYEPDAILTSMAAPNAFEAIMGEG